MEKNKQFFKNRKGQVGDYPEDYENIREILQIIGVPASELSTVSTISETPPPPPSSPEQQNLISQFLDALRCLQFNVKDPNFITESVFSIPFTVSNTVTISNNARSTLITFTNSMQGYFAVVKEVGVLPAERTIASKYSIKVNGNPVSPFHSEQSVQNFYYHFPMSIMFLVPESGVATIEVLNLSGRTLQFLGYMKGWQYPINYQCYEKNVRLGSHWD